MAIDLENAKANDAVGQDFEAHYIPGVTEKQLEDARALMGNLLKKYGGREGLEADEIDWAKYKQAMYIVASGSKDNMDKANKAREDLFKRKNLLSQFFDDNREVLFKLPEWARINLRKYTDYGLLVDQEYLWQALAELGEDKLADHLLNVANYIYNDTGFLGGVREDYEALQRGPIRSIYHRSTCKAPKTTHPSCGCGDDRGCGYT